MCMNKNVVGWLFSLISASLGGDYSSRQICVFSIAFKSQDKSSLPYFLEIVKTWLAKVCPFLEASAVISAAYFEQWRTVWSRLPTQVYTEEISCHSRSWLSATGWCQNVRWQPCVSGHRTVALFFRGTQSSAKLSKGRARLSQALHERILASSS